MDTTSQGDILIHGSSGLADTGYLWICSGYAVHNGKALLVLHNRFKYWVPPGGHIEPGETPAQAAEREFLEETGHAAEALSALPSIHSDSNATPTPGPFYVDIEREGFRKPALVQFFYMRLREPSRLSFDGYQRNELDAIGLFDEKELAVIPTFEQVRALARHAIHHHPRPTSD